MNYWLVKSEPDTYSWEKLVQEGEAVWDGVRNYQARNNLKLMKKGDSVLFYHSNIGLAVVGIARVAKEFFQDPTTPDERWVSVKLKPVKALKRPVTLSEIKAAPELSELLLVRHSRLSVMPVDKKHFDQIVALSASHASTALTARAGSQTPVRPL